MAMSNRTLSDWGSRASSVAGKTYSNLSSTTGEYLESGRDGMMHLADSVQDEVRNHPVRWVLVGIGLGCLLTAALLDR